MKKAFTIVEIILSMIIVSSLSYYLIVNNFFQNKLKETNNGYKNITYIISQAIMDKTLGYPNSLGGNCSSNHSYRFINAKRVHLCASLSSNFLVEGDFSNEDNYFTNLFPSLLKNGGRMYILSPSTIPSNQFIIFFDLSKTSFDHKKNKYFLESFISSSLSMDYSNSLKEVYSNIVSFDNPNDITNSSLHNGNKYDGIFAIKFEY